MNFAFSEEQEELRKSVRRFLDDKSSEAEVRRLMETTDGLRRRRLAPDGQPAGPPGPGHSRGVRRLRLLVDRARHRPRGDGSPLLVAPFFSTVVLAANTLLAIRRRRRQEEHLPGIASGETIATLAFTEDTGRWDAAGITTPATQAGDG